MPSLREVARVARFAARDKTSGARLREIRGILRKHHAFSGLTPSKVTAILEDLGPTFVKVGQLASNRSDMIPAEYAQAFKELRANVDPLPFDVVVSQIEESYGHPWQEVFASIEREPLGSASIAQVHKARLRAGGAGGVGAVVAVKVRRPFVAEQMGEDVALLKRAVALMDVVDARAAASLTLSSLVQELERTTEGELDFEVELGNLVRFGREVASQPGIASPQPYPRISTKEVLVMEYVEGSPINDVAALRAAGNDPDEVGRRLAESYVRQVIDSGFFHADPHPGNIVMRGHEAVWIDLGMVGVLGARERALVGQMLAAVARGDAFALKDALLGLAVPSGPVDHGMLVRQLDQLISAYGAADLSSLNMGSAFTEVIEVLRGQRLFLPPSLTMLARGLLALEGVLADVAPSISVANVMAKHLERQAFQPERLRAQAKDVARSGAASTHAAVRLPAQASRAFDLLNRGQMEVGANLRVPASALQALNSVAGTVSLALISAGLFIGSSLLATTDMQPKFLQVPVLGVAGYLHALILAAYVVYRSLRVKPKE